MLTVLAAQPATRAAPRLSPDRRAKCQMPKAKSQKPQRNARAQVLLRMQKRASRVSKTCSKPECKPAFATTRTPETIGFLLPRSNQLTFAPNATAQPLRNGPLPASF